MEDFKKHAKEFALQILPKVGPEGKLVDAEKLKNEAEILYQWLIKDISDTTN